MIVDVQVKAKRCIIIALHVLFYIEIEEVRTRLLHFIRRERLRFDTTPIVSRVRDDKKPKQTQGATFVLLFLNISPAANFLPHHTGKRRPPPLALANRNAFSQLALLLSSSRPPA